MKALFETDARGGGMLQQSRSCVGVLLLGFGLIGDVGPAAPAGLTRARPPGSLILNRGAGCGILLKSKPKQVRRLHKELTAVVNVAVRSSQQARGRGNQVAIEILEIAVVAHVNCCPRMYQVCDQKIGIEVLCPRQRTQQRIGKYVGVLQDHARGELSRELPVPFAADDVVGDHSQMGVPLPDVFQQIRIIDA